MFFPKFPYKKCPTFIDVGTNLSKLLVLIRCNLHGIKHDLKLGWAPNGSQNCIRGSTKLRRTTKNKKIETKGSFQGQESSNINIY
jgi:hypothetical protein